MALCDDGDLVGCDSAGGDRGRPFHRSFVLDEAGRDYETAPRVAIFTAPFLNPAHCAVHVF